MGSQYKATCRSCGHRFILNEGGGMAFEQMRCEECGRATAVLVDEQYLAGSPSKADWAKRMEARAGKCRCGGQYTLQAKPRCPKCRSVDLDKGNVEVLYD